MLHPDTRSRETRRLPEHGLAEAVSLAAALPNLEVLWAEVVRLPKLQPGTLFGSGKVAELKARIKADAVDLVLIDGPVSPVQQRNLEKEWGVKLLDRTGLILEIFADRARTREGVLQVELAALLKVLAEEPERAFSFEELLRKVWGYRAIGHTRTLEAHLSRLRAKLDPETRCYVQNCWGVAAKLLPFQS